MAPMYLDSVLFDIRKDSAPPKLLHAEHLFKLNEAVFNLNEDDTVDSEMATKIFQTVEMIRKSYNSGKFDNTDCNFFYDYLALLGTMQNQHFFSQTQTEKMLGWIREVMDDDSLAGSVPKEGAKASKKALKEMEANSHALEAEVATLRKRLAKYEASESSGGKAKSKGKKSPSPERGGKGSSGKKGKSSMYDDYYDYYEDDYYYEAPKGKSKGKGKGKADSSPPSTKGKGKGGKGYEEKGKGKDTGKGGKSPVKGSGKDGKDGKASAKGAKDSAKESKGSGKDAKGKAKDAKGSGKATAAAGKSGKETKGKGKKGKADDDDDSDDDDESPPPVRGSKGKGKGKDKGKGGKWKARD